MYRLRYFAALVLCYAVAVACTTYHEDDFPTDNQPTVEEDGSGNYISTFYMEPLWDFDELGYDGDEHNIKLVLYPVSHRVESYTFDATLREGKLHAVRLAIDVEQNGDVLPDKYVMRGYTEGGEKLTHEFLLSIRDRAVVSCQPLSVYDFSEVAQEEYGDSITKEDIEELVGSGDSDNPYKIFNAKMFEVMMAYLQQDTETHGRGKYFKQTFNIDLNDIKNKVTDEGWFGVDFAGNYDGNGKSITNLSHIGNSSKSTTNIGLFSTLHNGANISNLTINGNLTNVGSKCGMIAGSTANNAMVTISNCSVLGSIANCAKPSSQAGYTLDDGCRAQAGGAVGYVDGGVLSINDLTLGVQITNSGDCVGGVVGECASGHVSALQLSASVFKVEGGNAVGGIVGYCNNSSMTVEFSRINVTTMSDDVQVVVGKGCVGGIIGYITGYSIIYIGLTEIAYPVSGVNYVGGLAGLMISNGQLVIKGSTISSNIKASGDYAGGFVGWFKGNSTNRMAKISFIGKNWFSVAHQNKTGVSSVKYAGGIAGAMGESDGDANIEFAIGSKLYILSTISAEQERAGGLIGDMRRGYLHIDNVILHDDKSKVMSVVSSPLYAGGVAGYLRDECSIEASQRFSFKRNTNIDKIPSLSEIRKPDITVEVNGTEYVGGAVGYLERMTGLRYCHINAAVTGSSAVGGAIGGASGSSDGTRACQISNVVTNGEVTGSDKNVGGIVGHIKGRVEVFDCINYANVDDGGYGITVGGIVGYSEHSGDYGGAPHIYYCVNTGTVTGCRTVGGVLGASYASLGSYPDTIMVDCCANYGKINGNANDKKDSHTGYGGIMGTSSNTQGITLAHCANFGDIEVNCWAHGVGGIVGAIGNDPGGIEMSEVSNFHVWECANHGNISGSSSGFHCGGIAGYMEEGASTSGNHACVEGCYNWGDIDVDVDGDHGLGGLAGYLDRYAEIWRSINFKMLTGYTGESNTGRIWGKCKGSYTTKYNYYMSSENKDGGFTEDKMSNASTFGDLNINKDGSFWVMSDGDPHPQIRNCPFQNATYNE